ncbi:MAG: relaxase/mobilization nuclease domain-containing protein [Desulfovibrio sp.]|jgi:hypothetical protein|nr:relaxase/mobilization nuclease domain-containing protein [Desulfovibrio sp.]
MILKKLKRTSFKKSKAVMIRTLVDYILAATDEGGNEKTKYAGAKNLLGRTPDGWKAEMVSLASESIQSKMPVTHWIMSWQENEQPSYEQIEDAVDVFLDRMGLAGHQVIYSLHGNSANLHLHIAVNRTNPDTLKVIQPHRGFDIEEAHRIVALLEHRQGWASESHPRYVINDQGEIVRRQSKPISKPRNEAANFESATGEKSAQRIAQERGHSIIKNAASWAELHQGMAKAGLRFEKKGSGAIVFVGDIAVKASSVDRNFSMGKLCKRLGDFEPGDYAPEMPKPEPEPVSHIALEEWREYRKFRAEEAENRLMAQKRAEDSLLQARARQREERKAAASDLARHGLHILNIARHFLMLQQREELARLRADPPAPRKRLKIFKRWLGERDPWLASLWRLRRRVFYGMNVKPFQFPKIGDMASPYAAYREIITKRFPENMDASRLDAAVALRMRVAGYTREEVANGMYRKARPLRKESRDWKEYARRTVWYAFGTAGDVDIAEFKPTQADIMKFHQEAERLEAARLAAERARVAEAERQRAQTQRAEETPPAPRPRML